MGNLKVIILVAVALTLSACQTTQRAKPGPQLPSTAWAPEPLPLPKSRPSLDAITTGPTDAVGDLIDKVEAKYAAGLRAYSAGNREDAKVDFDQALGILLASNMDIQDHERLDDEFNTLVDNINSIELSAIQNGDFLSEHQYVPAPIESFSGLTFPVDPNVSKRVQEEIRSVHSDLPLVSNEYVDGVIAFLQKHGRTYMNSVLRREGEYRPLIESALRKEGVPGDLIYLAAGESAFNPFAISNKGAKGIWQFMSGTAALYGLKRNQWVDEREDPVKSTMAAARLLKELHEEFGDWFLAMAAYDSNPLTVQRAIARTGYADYWELRKLHALPTETQNYVPIFLATALIAKDPQIYGFSVPVNPPLDPDKVVTPYPTDLRLVAGLIGQPVQQLVRLNPSLQRWSTPANDPKFVLNLPAGTKSLYETGIAAVPPGKRMWWRAQTVAAGDTLANVARHYHVSPYTLAKVNSLSPEDALTAGTHLVVPLPSGNLYALQRVHPGWTKHVYHYHVRRGESIELVADHFDVTPYQVRRWNHLRGSRIPSSRTLVIYKTAAHSPASHRRAVHRSSKRRLARKSTVPHHAVRKRKKIRAASKNPSPPAQAPHLQ
ncbi:MAG TPA: transglycosylase SLT domain-containing protein [Terriglobia bacterium]|nr:transglycosylase SLT domain-containing protein [Terriglobia bacterium]